MTVLAQTKTAPSVLVVDDEPDMRMLARFILEKGGFKVADEAGPECADVLQHQSGRTVFVRVERDRFEQPRRDPPCADLLSGKRRRVENNDIGSCAAERPRARRPCGWGRQSPSPSAARR